jgi:hypothetical protein
MGRVGPEESASQNSFRINVPSSSTGVTECLAPQVRQRSKKKLLGEGLRREKKFSRSLDQGI